MIYSRIAGTGRYLPDRILTNADLEKIVDTTDEWIISRTGIEQRHAANEDEFTSDLCVNAARNAMESAALSPSDIDMLFVGTTTPDLIFPNIATIIQHKLGIPALPCYAIEAACSGFVYALSSADKFIRCGEAKKVLVIGAEIITRLVDWEDRNTCVLFGDGAGAVILEASSNPGVLSTHLGADGQYQKLLYYPVGASTNLAAAGTADASIMMSGNDVFKVAVRTLSEIAKEALNTNKLSLEDLDWFIPHQANLRIIQAAAKKLNMPMEKVIQTVQIHGNTSAASIPMAFDVGVRDGRIKRGQLVLFDAFGGGFTWGAVLLRY